MVAVLLPTARKAVETERKTAANRIDENWPCFIVAFTLASVKLFMGFTGIEDFKISGIDDVNVFFLMELGSTPLAIINPRVWFGVFMCSLGYMCVETGYPTMAILSITSMLVVAYGMEYLDYRKRRHSKNHNNVYQILPLVDATKLKEQQLV